MSGSMHREPDAGAYPPFDRRFFESDADFTVIGGGQIGGKALGLATIKRIIGEAGQGTTGGATPGTTADALGTTPGVTVSIPRLTVLATDVFEQFMARNDLYDVALADGGNGDNAGNLPDERIAHAFLKAEMPPLVLGDLRALVERVRTPLAVRSSSLLEDALRHPFAGVYATKMIPNNQASVGDRFRKLTEAIKFVWASTFFRDAKSYMRAIKHRIEDERMAVIIQEVVGERFEGRFYPIVSGVIRTYNYYPTGPAKPEHGVVHLALGLGKTIVDGGVTWTYSPRRPSHRPPFGSMREMLQNTQTRFWAVSMEPVLYDPINEAEHLVQAGLDIAEWDDVLRFTASTYDAASDRLTLGVSVAGPRVLTFGPLLELGDVPLNQIVRRLAEHCRQSLQCDVEIEFAMTLDRAKGLPARFGFLQVRPMMVADDLVEVDLADLRGDRALVASEAALGNGADDSVTDVVYVKPTAFAAERTREIAAEIASLNAELVSQDRPYVLIGFGRWGSVDPWLGIPVTWPQISGARVIVEATLPEMNVDASQGSHFFHNMISFRVLYFSVRHTDAYAIAWDWLDQQPASTETRFLRHVRLAAPLRVRVDGRHGRGVILHN